jgi:putative NADPH-quinone reductase
MKVLLIDGFDDEHPIVTSSRGLLSSRGHTVTDLRLLEEGFGTFMSAAERRVYHDETNLVTEETRHSAELVQSHDAVLVCAPLVAGTISPYVKSWFERVFLPGVSFTFTKSGRVTAALTNIKRIGMIVDYPDDDPAAHKRSGSARSVMRGVRLSCSKRCRMTYAVAVSDAETPAVVGKALARW